MSSKYAASAISATLGVTISQSFVSVIRDLGKISNSKEAFEVADVVPKLHGAYRSRSLLTGSERQGVVKKVMQILTELEVRCLKYDACVSVLILRRAIRFCPRKIPLFNFLLVMYPVSRAWKSSHRKIAR